MSDQVAEQPAAVYMALLHLQEVAVQSSRRQQHRSRRWRLVRVVLGIVTVGGAGVAAFLATTSDTTWAAAAAAIAAATSLVWLVTDPGRRSQRGLDAAVDYRSLAERAERARLFDPGPGDPVGAGLVAEGLEQLKQRLDGEAGRAVSFS